MPMRLLPGDRRHAQVAGRHGARAWARIDTTRRNSPINVSFPHLSSGGYFVNGVEGQVTQGLNGFFTGGNPAVPGQTLLLEYGQP
jgi:hypothetical protein